MVVFGSFGSGLKEAGVSLVMSNCDNNSLSKIKYQTILSAETLLPAPSSSWSYAECWILIGPTFTSWTC